MNSKKYLIKKLQLQEIRNIYPDPENILKQIYHIMLWTKSIEIIEKKKGNPEIEQIIQE